MVTPPLLRLDFGPKFAKNRHVLKCALGVVHFLNAPLERIERREFSGTFRFFIRCSADQQIDFEVRGIGGRIYEFSTRTRRVQVK